MNNKTEHAKDVHWTKKAGRGVIKVVLWLSLFVVVFIIGTALLSSVSLDQLNNMRSAIDRFDGYFQFVRWLALLLMCLWWKEIFTWIGKHKQWSANQIALIHYLRWKVCGLFILIELIFIQRVFELFI